MQRTLFTAWTGSGCAVGRLKSSLPRETERVSVQPFFIFKPTFQNFPVKDRNSSAFLRDWKQSISLFLSYLIQLHSVTDAIDVIFEMYLFFEQFLSSGTVIE